MAKPKLAEPIPATEQQQPDPNAKPTSAEPQLEVLGPPAPAETATKTSKAIASFAGEKLELVKSDGRKITLAKQTNARGTNKWSYPGITFTDDTSDGELNLLNDSIIKFLGDREATMMFLGAFDAYCQSAWKGHDNEADFRLYMVEDTVKRMPRKMSAFYDRARQAKTKELLEYAKTVPAENRKTDARLLALKAERDDLMAKYQSALDEELMTALD